jgi:DNA-directed RNA polymerase specialized sigma24 family protein
LSFQELGEVLGVPLRTAQARVTSGLEALRKELAASAPSTSRHTLASDRE